MRLFILTLLVGCGSDLEIEVQYPDPIFVCSYDEYGTVLDKKQAYPDQIPEGYVQCEEEANEKD